MGPDWSELTQECLIDIFSRLSMQQRWNGPMLVCKTWTNTCKDPSLNSVFDLEAQFLSSNDSYNFWWNFEFSQKVDLSLMSVVDQSQGGLKEIRVRYCTNQSLSYVAERCPNLEVLWVKYSPKVTVESMRKIALNCLKLKELDISCSYEISPECIEIVGRNCKNLQILKRNLMDPSEVMLLISRSIYDTYWMGRYFYTVGNVDASVILRHMSQLKHLELRFSTLTDIALKGLCQECSNLEYLDLFGCMNLTSDGVTNHTSSLKNLKEIKKPNFTALVFSFFVVRYSRPPFSISKLTIIFFDILFLVHDLMRSRSRPNWTELTRECLLDIFSRLSMEQRWYGPMLVCKTWTNTCRDPSLNSVFDLENRFLYSRDPSKWWSPEFAEKVDLSLMSVVDQSQGGLNKIRVRPCTNQSLSYVAERCPNLEVLWVKYSPKVTIESMRKIALNCSKLKELDISGSYEITPKCLELVGMNCKNLQMLKRNMMNPPLISGYLCSVIYTTLHDLCFKTLGNADVYVIVKYMPQLKHLELRFSTLTDIALGILCQKCLSLEYLDLFGCKYLTSEGVTKHTSSLKNLKEIKKPKFKALL